MAIFHAVGLAWLARWLHVLAGVTWIGLLYYFNFVQGPSVAQMDPATRTGVTTKLAPRALWWFRMGAMVTLVTGLLIAAFNNIAEIGYTKDFFKSLPGVSISLGMLMGLIMFLNVWLVIWPAQKIVIASAEGVAGGGEPDPAAADAARRGFVASRTNVLLSGPMLFFMTATSHFVVVIGPVLPSASDRRGFLLIAAVLIALVEANALGLLGGVGPSPLRKPLETVRDVIVSSLVFAAIFYVLMELFFG